jgi:phage terminase large subunit-like protein
LATTTPRGVPHLQAILTDPKTVVTHAPTSANAMHLAKSFVAQVTARYGGTALGRQELEGELILDLEGTL